MKDEFCNKTKYFSRYVVTGPKILCHRIHNLYIIFRTSKLWNKTKNLLIRLIGVFRLTVFVLGSDSPDFVTIQI